MYIWQKKEVPQKIPQLVYESKEIEDHLRCGCNLSRPPCNAGVGILYPNFAFVKTLLLDLARTS